MLISKRSFLVGVSAALASAVTSNANVKFMTPTSVGSLNAKIPFRSVQEIMVSAMPTGEELAFTSGFVEDPIRYTFYRNNCAILHFMLNPRAAYRWVATPDGEVKIGEKDVFRLDIEPCWTHVALQIISATNPNGPTRENPWPDRNMISETFHWVDGVAELDSAVAMNPFAKLPKEWGVKTIDDD